MGATFAQRRAAEARNSDRNRHLADAIRQRMRACRITQVKLAAELGINQATVNRWLQLRVAVPLTELPAIAAVLGVTVRELYANGEAA